MSDSETFDALEEKHERNRQQRLVDVKHWVDYITDQPAEVWGPQQNAVVNSQLESAQEAGLDADHERRVRAFAESVAADEDTTDSDS